MALKLSRIAFALHSCICSLTIVQLCEQYIIIMIVLDMYILLVILSLLVLRCANVFKASSWNSPLVAVCSPTSILQKLHIHLYTHICTVLAIFVLALILHSIFLMLGDSSNQLPEFRYFAQFKQTVSLLALLRETRELN